MKTFYKRLSYSFGNEDFNTEAKALQLKPTDHVFTITASGDRTLNILSSPVQKVYSIDVNPIQNALLDLKRAALKTFDYPDYLAFLGLHPCLKRKERFAEIEKILHPTSREILLPLQSKIEKGIIYQGAIEKIICSISLLVRLLRGKKVYELFSFQDLEAQAGFVKQHWNTPVFRNLFKIAIHPYTARFFFKDPGLYEHIGQDIKSPSHLYNRFFQKSLTRFLARENIILSLALVGKVFEEGYPPYLREQETEQIKQQLDKMEFETTDLLTALQKRPNQSLDAFSLSDVASYLSQEKFCLLLKEVVRTAKPGARFCIRQFLSNHAIPKEVAPFLKRDVQLEEQLAEEDRCVVYRFLTGTVVK